jgi:hypothetical protein
MSADGAHLGVSAERAIKTILGGEPSPEEGDADVMDVNAMREWLLSAAAEHAMDSYDECARYAGRLILESFLADPDLAQLPGETEYDWEADPDHGTHGMKPQFVVHRSLYDVLEERGVPLGDLGLSGFMWGWAVNAARRCVELGPVANPAIMTVGERVEEP